MKHLCKKILVLLLTILLLLTVSCANKVDPPIIDDNTNEKTDTVPDGKIETDSSSQSISNTETETLMVDNSRPDYLHYSFADVRDLENALKSSNKGGVLEGFKAESDACKTLMDKFESSEMKLSYPVIKSTGKVDMTSNISLFSYELYTLPWIWYQGDVDGSRLTVKISYLSKQLTDYASNHSMSETIKYIAPDAPNVDNYDSKSSYLMIKESNIIVNGGSCNALISQTTNGETYIQFVIGDIFVVVSGKSSLLTSTFVSNIYFDQLD